MCLLQPMYHCFVFKPALWPEGKICSAVALANGQTGNIKRQHFIKLSLPYPMSGLLCCLQKEGA